MGQENDVAALNSQAASAMPSLLFTFVNFENEESKSVGPLPSRVH